MESFTLSQYILNILKIHKVLKSMLSVLETTPSDTR